MADVDTSFAPAFGDKFSQLQERLRAQGINAHVISGRRSTELQNELYQDWLAQRAGKPDPYPGHGRIPVAAPPGSSAHEQGYAADIIADNPADQPKVWEAAKTLGLAAAGPSDPGHIYLPSWQQYARGGKAPTATAAVSAPPAVSEARVAEGAPDYGSMIRNYASSIGLDPDRALAIARAEGLNAWNAQNPNAQSYVRGPGGQREQSFGDFQLHVGGVADAAKAAGIDVTDPSQRWAADKFALDYMKAHGTAPWRTDAAVKEMQRQGASIYAGGAPSTSTAMVNTPMGPSTVAPPATAVASSTPPTGPPTSVGDALNRLTTPEKDAQGNEKPGTSAIDKIAKPFQQDKQAMAEAARDAPQMPQAPPDTSAMLPPAAQQLLTQTMANASRPLTWSSAPYGSGLAGQQMGPLMGYPMAQGGIQQPQIPGLTLNSLGMGMGYYG